MAHVINISACYFQEPYVNQSAVSVPGKFSLERAYIIFRTLGLRHMAVVDELNRVIGVITRKDLMGFNMAEKLLAIDQKPLERRMADDDLGDDEMLLLVSENDWLLFWLLSVSAALMPLASINAIVFSNLHWIEWECDFHRRWDDLDKMFRNCEKFVIMYSCVIHCIEFTWKVFFMHSWPSWHSISLQLWDVCWLTGYNKLNVFLRHLQFLQNLCHLFMSFSFAKCRFAVHRNRVLIINSPSLCTITFGELWASCVKITRVVSIVCELFDFTSSAVFTNRAFNLIFIHLPLYRGNQR